MKKWSQEMDTKSRRRSVYTDENRTYSGIRCSFVRSLARSLGLSTLELSSSRRSRCTTSWVFQFFLSCRQSTDSAPSLRTSISEVDPPPLLHSICMSHQLLGRQQRHRKERAKSKHEAAEKRQASSAIYQQQLEQHAIATQQALVSGLSAPPAPEAPKSKRRAHHTKDGSLRNHRVRVRRGDSTGTES